jgi:hypothetical protein
MPPATDYYKEKNEALPRFVYRRLAAAIAAADGAEARGIAIAAFLDVIERDSRKGDYLKLKWVLPNFVRALLSPDEQHTVDDALSQRRERQSGKLFGVYPHCSDEFSLDPAFITAAFDAVPRPLFDPSTPIFTIGSCFARNISNFLIQHGFNSINFRQFEDINSPYSNAVMLAAAIAPDHERETYLRWWLNAILEGNTPAFIDNILLNETLHLQALRERIAASRLLIITLGNTVDYHLEPGNEAPAFDDIRVAPKFLGVAASEDVDTRLKLSNKFHKLGTRLRLTTHAECLAALQALHRAIRRVNPNAPVIYTLSPVPIDSAMGLEGAGTAGAIEIDCISKSTLRAALAEFMTMPDSDAGSTYFPSYEIVRWLGAMLPSPAFGVEDAASRHVSAGILDAIYGFFLRKHGAPAAKAAL